jgi:tripartite-type tricarboxylate transporter receptor subunit TctC
MTHRFRYIFAALCIAAPAAAQDYPSKDIQGTIMWGAGGATDNLARVLAPAAEEALGEDIVLVNRAGGVGAIAIQHMLSRPADGYEILFGAENPQLHKVLGIAEHDYSEFYPVKIMGRNIQVFFVLPDAEWQTIRDLVADIQENPGEIRMGATGPGGSPEVSMGMLQSVVDAEVTVVPFDGEGPALTALQGGHVDFVPASLPAGSELLRAERLRGIAVLDTEPLENFPDIPVITDFYPDLSEMLPWGSFQGVFVLEETPEDVKQTLTDAFTEAMEDPNVKDFINSSGMTTMNISGDEAKEFMNRWQAVTSWILQDIGSAVVSPEEFGIERP